MGFVNRVYPAAELERETLAYAARVAESDPFDLRTVKSTINQTLDIMGFSNSVRLMSPQFLNRRGRPRSATNPPPPREEGIFRNRVKRALEYLREDRGKHGQRS